MAAMEANFRHDMVVIDQQGQNTGVDGFAASLHNTIILALSGASTAPKSKSRNTLPRLVTGDLVSAIAMRRARCRVRPSGDQDHRAERRQRLPPQTDRKRGFPMASWRTSSSLWPRPIRLRAPRVFRYCCWKPTGAEGFQRGQKNSTRSGSMRRTPASCSSTTSSFRPIICSAGVEGRGFYQLMGEAAAGTPCHRYERHHRHRKGARCDGRIRQETARPSARRSGISRTPSSCSPTSRPAEPRRGCSSMIAIAKLLEGKLDVATASMAKYWVTELQSESGRQVSAIPPVGQATSMITPSPGCTATLPHRADLWRVERDHEDADRKEHVIARPPARGGCTLCGRYATVVVT